MQTYCFFSFHIQIILLYLQLILKISMYDLFDKGSKGFPRQAIVVGTEMG